MSFHVEPPALRTFSRHLDACALDAAEARTYVTSYGDFNFREEGMLLGMLRSAHTNLVDELRARMGHLQDVLEQSAVEMNGAARRYEQTDGATAAKVDATYPAPDRPTTVR